MFFLGFILGIIVGGFIIIKLIQYGLYYVGQHPELIDKIVDQSLKEVLKNVVDRAENKLDLFQ